MDPNTGTVEPDSDEGYTAPRLTPLGDVLDAAATVVTGTL